MDISKKIKNAYDRLAEFDGVVTDLKVKFATADNSAQKTLQRQWTHLLMKCEQFRTFLTEQEKPLPGFI